MVRLAQRVSSGRRIALQLSIDARRTPAYQHDGMTLPARHRPPVEPLFASNERLWLRVWASTQAVALTVACYVMLDSAGGPRAFLASPKAVRSIAMIALLVTYHAIGIRAYAWIIRRAWAVSLFVPAGWVIVLASLEVHGTFGLLILGAILQGFIFLPFTWAIGTLALLIVLTVFLAVLRGPAQGPSLMVARVVGLLATGITFGTVMLYIHRSNRDSAVRSRLLDQLDRAQRDLAERSREAGAQEERQRLARDIHDTLAQGFASVIKHLEAIELSFAAPRAEPADVIRGALPHLTNAQAVSRASLGEIRRLVWALRPPQLVETTLSAAIERIVTQWSETNGIAATCAIAELPALQPDAEVTFLRATQEALSNVARHAKATRVSVAMHCVDGLVMLSVEDDGRGFVESASSGPGKMGIVGMRERVRPFGGRVLIENGSESGTSLIVALPLAAIASPP
jgi:signal transduction histidine kinase